MRIKSEVELSYAVMVKNVGFLALLLTALTLLSAKALRKRFVGLVGYGCRQVVGIALSSSSRNCGSATASC